MSRPRVRQIHLHFAAAFSLIIFITIFLNLSHHFYENTIHSGNTALLYNNASYTKENRTNISFGISNATRKYFVNSSKCRLKYVEPFPPEIWSIYNHQKFESCRNQSDKDVFTISFDVNIDRYIIHTEEDLIQKLLADLSMNEKKDDAKCCYREIERLSGGDGYIKIRDCQEFGQDFVVPITIDGIIVECSTITSHILLYQDAFAFVQDREVKQRNSVIKQHSTERKSKPSILLIGIDSMSRMNLRRSMPNTFQYLVDTNWYEMQGYTKVGDNTFPNLIPLLTGYNEANVMEICRPKELGGLDSCPFIWKYFKTFNYVTAYGEDEPTISSFKYLKPGFDLPPVDHYLQPFLFGAEKHLQIKKRWGLNYCLGRRLSMEYVYDYCQQFASRYKDSPYFGLFWTNTFSHNAHDGASAMDDKMLEYLKNLEKNNILNESIVIFFSDHGFRYGDIANKMADGFYEQRLPMMFIWLPAWFKSKYRAYANALDINQNRLTSPYDIYNTLIHLAQLPAHDWKVSVAPNCYSCQTLLHSVAENRTCEEAGIPQHWCSCIPYKTISETDEIKQAVISVVEKINEYLEEAGLRELCQTMVLREISSVVEKDVLWNAEHNDTKSTISTYRIKFSTNPNDDSYEVTVHFNTLHQTLEEFDLESSISRLDSYEKESRCIDNKNARKYCVCY